MSAYVNMCVCPTFLRRVFPHSAQLTRSVFLRRFNASRIPQIPEDTSIKYPTSNGQNDHVIVLRKNRMFKVRIGGLGVDEIDRSVILLAVLHRSWEFADLCLAFIRLFDEVIHVVGADEGPKVGLLTSQNRDVWTKVRQLDPLDP
jgi:hypothetical protein